MRNLNLGNIGLFWGVIRTENVNSAADPESARIDTGYGNETLVRCALFIGTRGNIVDAG